MMEVMEEKDVYLSSYAQLEKELGQRQPAWLQELRQAAIDRFAELGFPTLRDEDWRFTNLAALTRVPFRLAERKHGKLTAERLRQAVPTVGTGPRLVFVNGWYAEELSVPSAGARNLASVVEQKPELVKAVLGQYAQADEHPFIALNMALARDGAFVRIPDGTVMPEPIQLVFVSLATGQPSVWHPRNVIVVGRGSQVCVVESYVGWDEEPSFTNAVTEIVVGENGVVDHYKLQEESRSAFHVATQQVQLSRSSQFRSHLVSLGGSLVRNEVNAVLDGEGIECTLNGLYMASGEQHVDNRTFIDHAQPHCTSHELYKGILSDRGRGVFNGKIYVHQDAQKTDAKQTNQTLLLSEDATINTKPQLEIYADDVKCTHGATVGQLQEEALFYLRSRGIGMEAARGLLTYAFANDIISRIRVAGIRHRLEEMLLARQQLPTGHDFEEFA